MIKVTRKKKEKKIFLIKHVICLGIKDKLTKNIINVIFQAKGKKYIIIDKY